MRKCKSCEIEKNESDFYSRTNFSKKKGEYIYFYPECKKCTSIRADLWQKRNPDRHKESRKRYDSKPHRKLAHYKRSKERIENGKHREYIRKNPEKVKEYANNHRNHDISVEQWASCKNYFANDNDEWCCAYCGFLYRDHYKRVLGSYYKQDLHKEHVDHNGSNDLSNCIPACQSCNSSKRQYNMIEWYKNKEFYTERRYHRILDWLEKDHKRFL